MGTLITIGSFFGLYRSIILSKTRTSEENQFEYKSVYQNAAKKDM